MTCAWEPDPACLGDKWDQLTPEIQERSLMLATSALLDLTNYRVGTCPVTIRPCAPIPRCGCAGGWTPYLRNGQWFNGCCNAPCAPLHEYEIPGPVGFIDSLLVDGDEVDLWNGDWRIDNGNILVWQGGGSSPIPETQDLNLPDTEPGTWSITYSRSYPVGPDGRLAVAQLALEFAEACKPKGKCSLPRGVVNVVRHGVSFTVDAGMFVNGLTGIHIVDAYITKWNPAGSPVQTAQVFSPRNQPVRRVSAVPARRIPGSA